MRTEARKRVAVLISGRGSNLGALIAACAGQDFPARIVLAVSDRPAAGGLALAERAGIATRVVDGRSHATKAAFEAALQAELLAHAIEIVCLAGFMRLLSASFVESWRDRMLNIHPSLLPAFPGLDTHERALAAGVAQHGATVHFVRPQMDAGPVIVQGVVPVLPQDGPAALAERVLDVEHRIFPLALALVARDRVRVVGERAWMTGPQQVAAAGIILPERAGDCDS